jgi:hypothetical protein
VAAIAAAGIAGAVTGALTSAPPAVTAMTARTSFVRQTAPVRRIQVAITGPSMVWRLTKTANHSVVAPGEQITYTITLQQLQSPFSVAARMCLDSTNRPDCETANTILLAQPVIVDDLSGVTGHAVYDHDAEGAPGTIVQVKDRAGSTVVSAEPDTALADVTRLRFTFSVRVKHHTKPGTTIRNTAYVSVHTGYVPAPGPLTNCSLSAVFTHGAVSPSCTAVSVIPPAKGGAQTGFGGMAGHVGNLGRH